MDKTNQCVVRITKVNRGFIKFQNSSAETLHKVVVGQIRAITLIDGSDSYYLKVGKVRLLVHPYEIEYKLIPQELPNG